MSTTNNVDWINTVKTFGIILVFFFHSEFYMKMDLTGFHSIYTPFFTNSFFFVSGYLLLRRQWSSEFLSLSPKKWFFEVPKGSGSILLSNILFRIAIPTIIFATLLYFPKVFLRGEGFSVRSFLHDTICGGSIWFTSSLAVSQLILLMLLALRIRRRSVYVGVSLLLTILAVLFARDSNGAYGTQDTPWFWKGGFIATLFLVGGGIYYEYEECIHKVMGKTIFLVGGIIAYLGTILFFSSNVRVSINVGAFNVLGAIMSFLSILLLIELCRKVPYNKRIEYIGRHTLVLYFLSGAIPNVLAMFIMRCFANTVITYLLCSFLSFLVAIPVTIFINRYMPFLTDLRKLKLNRHGF